MPILLLQSHTWNQRDSVLAAELGWLEDVRLYCRRVCFIGKSALPYPTLAIAVKRTARGDGRVLRGREGIAAERLEEMNCQLQL